MSFMDENIVPSTLSSATVIQKINENDYDIINGPRLFNILKCLNVKVKFVLVLMFVSILDLSIRVSPGKIFMAGS